MPYLRTMGAVDPGTAGTTGQNVFDKIGGVLNNLLPSPTPAPAAPTGMSSTTKLMIAGGAVLLVALIARR